MTKQYVKLIEFKYVCLLYLIINIVASCTQKHVTKLNDRDNTYKTITSFFPLNTKKIGVYYYDGDCAFCIAKMRQINNLLGNENKLVFIAQTSNEQIFKFNTSKFKLNIIIKKQPSQFKSLSLDNFYWVYDDNTISKPYSTKDVNNLSELEVE